MDANRYTVNPTMMFQPTWRLGIAAYLLTSPAGCSTRYDVENSVRDQVYDGFHKEDFRAAREVQRTRGVVLTADGLGEDPEPLKAFYHSTCGGHTVLPQADKLTLARQLVSEIGKRLEARSLLT